MNKLVDPLLEGVYDVAQMNNMVLAAFLSIQQTAQRRPQMSQVLTNPSLFCNGMFSLKFIVGTKSKKKYSYRHSTIYYESSFFELL